MTQLARLAVMVALASAAAGGASGAVAAGGASRIVVVAPPRLAADHAAVAAIERSGASVRLARSPNEQLAVTHLLAARGATIVGVGLLRRVAVDPVAARYPRVRFVLLPATASPHEVRAATARAA